MGSAFSNSVCCRNVAPEVIPRLTSQLHAIAYRRRPVQRGSEFIMFWTWAGTVLFLFTGIPLQLRTVEFWALKRAQFRLAHCRQVFPRQ